MQTGNAFDFKNKILNYQQDEGKPHFAAFAEAFKEELNQVQRLAIFWKGSPTGRKTDILMSMWTSSRSLLGRLATRRGQLLFSSSIGDFAIMWMWIRK